MGNQKSVPLPSPQPGGPGRLRSCNLHCFFVGGPGFQRPTADFISFGSFSCFSFTCPGRPHRVDRGIAQGGFQRSVLKSLLRGEPQSRGVPAGLAGGQRARRGGNPPAPAFPGGETGKGRSNSLRRRLFPPQCLSLFLVSMASCIPRCFNGQPLRRPCRFLFPSGYQLRRFDQHRLQMSCCAVWKWAFFFAGPPNCFRSRTTRNSSPPVYSSRSASPRRSPAPTSALLPDLPPESSTAVHPLLPQRILANALQQFLANALQQFLFSLPNVSSVVRLNRSSGAGDFGRSSPVCTNSRKYFF